MIKQRLSELGFDQRDLAAATQVTESYVSQLLTRRKAPPAPGRTDMYDKIGEFLKLALWRTFEAGGSAASGGVEEACDGAAQSLCFRSAAS